MSVRETVVAGAMAEIIDGDHAANRPLDNRPRPFIGRGRRGQLRRSVGWAEVKRADELLGGGRRKAGAFGESEGLVAGNVTGGEGGEGEDDGEEEKREFCHWKIVEIWVKLRQTFIEK